MKSLQQRLIELDNRDADAAIIELRRLTVEIKANNKTYRMAQDRANDDIETLTADINEYQQQQDEIIVALGSQGILPSEIVGKVRSLLAENRKYKNWFDDNGAVLATHRIGGFFFPDPVSTQQNKPAVLSETETQMQLDGETDVARRKLPDEGNTWRCHHCGEINAGAFCPCNYEVQDDAPE